MGELVRFERLQFEAFAKALRAAILHYHCLSTYIRNTLDRIQRLWAILELGLPMSGNLLSLSRIQK